jgi:hypothetical protein
MRYFYGAYDGQEFPSPDKLNSCIMESYLSGRKKKTYMA